ncbi:MAG: hypothetical protein NTU41_03060, partial [Chloroflexi bacterium]|nr:hypothetical protein [Chloroflexota bacterium]
MNRADLGRLIASLRREHDDERGGPWSQERLAREANLAMGRELMTREIVGNVERGRRALDDEMAQALAAALQLTSGERREFSLALSPVDSAKMAREGNDPHEALAELLNRLTHVHMPACILDPHCDILAINAPAAEVLQLECHRGCGHESDNKPFACNLMSLIF